MHEMESFVIKNFKILFFNLVHCPGFNSISPDKINVIFRYKRLYLFFILLIVNSLKCISAEKSLTLLVIRKTSIVKNSFVGEFLRILLRLSLLWQTTLSEWNAMVNCIKEIITKRTFDLRLYSYLYKNNRDIVKIIQ